jgi:hypothetical protein
VQRRFGAALRRLLAKEAAQLEQQQRFRQMQQLEQLDQGPQWCASNRVFVDGRVLTLSAAYLTLLQVHYGDDSSGLIQTIDFDAAEEAAQVGRTRAKRPAFILSKFVKENLYVSA